MNIEQAIDELYSIRDFWLLPRHGDNGRAFEVRKAVDMAVAALRTQRVEKNEPLTLDELLKMDGQPVFVTSAIGEQPMWYIVDVEENELKNPWDRLTLEDWDDGYPYKAYRRPPEKEETK